MPEAYSPAPWHLNEDGRIECADGRLAGEMRARDPFTPGEHAWVIADRTLMASAPAMLDALRDIAAFQDSPANQDLTFSEAVARMAAAARAAIAKAGA